jgi:hypothetical protein
MPQRQCLNATVLRLAQPWQLLATTLTCLQHNVALQVEFPTTSLLSVPGAPIPYGSEACTPTACSLMAFSTSNESHLLIDLQEMGRA